MNSLILKVAGRWLLPLFLVMSVLVMYRGHNAPGGGFIGGLLAASGFILTAFAEGLSYSRRKLRISPHALIALGLLISMASAFPAVFLGLPLMTGLWWGHVGTPILFDVGVFFTVIGVVMLIFYSIAQESETEDRDD